MSFCNIRKEKMIYTIKYIYGNNKRHRLTTEFWPNDKNIRSSIHNGYTKKKKIPKRIFIL